MSLLVQTIAATLLLMGSGLVFWVVRSTDRPEPKLRPAVAAAKKQYQPEHKAA